MCFQPFKTSIRVYRSFFPGINGNLEGEKRRGVKREIFLIFATIGFFFLSKSVFATIVKYSISLIFIKLKPSKFSHVKLLSIY
jgi:hypothetical protein